MEKTKILGIVSIDELTETAFALYVPHGIKKEKAMQLFKTELNNQLADINVIMLLKAALYLDKINSGDSVSLVADEVIGMSIANYINGTKAVFEFKRYDTEKPGILSKLPSFADDAIAALIAGIMSRLYEKDGKD